MGGKEKNSTGTGMVPTYCTYFYGEENAGHDKMGGALCPVGL